MEPPGPWRRGSGRQTSTLSSSTLSSIGARCSQLLKLAYITSLWERNLREGLKRELGEIISYR